jgi:hypothetical protein
VAIGGDHRGSDRKAAPAAHPSDQTLHHAEVASSADQQQHAELAPRSSDTEQYRDESDADVADSVHFTPEIQIVQELKEHLKKIVIENVYKENSYWDGVLQDLIRENTPKKQ